MTPRTGVSGAQLVPTNESGSRLSGWLARCAWFVAIGAALILVAKAFIGDLYAVKSGSMRPTLFGGAATAGGEEFREHVLVSYDRAPELERFDLVVLDASDGGPPLVKRVVGLPGEKVSISEGDLLVEGARLPLDAERPAPIPVFDEARHAIEDVFDFAAAPAGPWSFVDGAWRVDAGQVEENSRAAEMSQRRGIRDDYLDQNGDLVRGTRPVNDAILAGELTIDEVAREGARVRLGLVEEGDTFQVRMQPRDDGQLLLRIVRYNARTLTASDPALKMPILAEETVPFTIGEPLRFRFANLDNHVFLDLDGKVVLRATYEANEPPLKTAQGTSARGARASFGAEGLVARFRGMSVSRDLFYTSAGSYGTDREVRLGLDEYFVLGDNSAASTDSRSFGPIPSGRIVGLPIAVLWPFSRARRLSGAEIDPKSRD